MADLSDSDKKILLGSGYKADQAARDAKSGITDATRLAKRKSEIANDLMFGAVGVGVIALIIFVTNFYSVAIPYNANLAIGSAVVVLGSIAVAVWFGKSRNPR